MIDYLKDFSISIEEYDLIEARLSKEMISNFNVMQNNVVDVLTYLKELGVSKVANVIIYRPDLCFKSIADLQMLFKKIDIELLIYIINNSPDDLTCFDI
jgi:hypothetical protein